MIAVATVPSAAEIRIDYAADDSCEIRCWARGHFEPAAFLAACEAALKAWDGRGVVLANKSVAHETWRTVRADAETRAIGVCDLLHIKSQPGRGAYPVTVLADWLPL